MVRLRHLCLTAALLALWVATVSTDASADDASPTDVAAARKLGVEGVKLANAGQCLQAIDRLARAEKLFHAPTILGRLGECQVNVGKLVEGTESLQRVVRDPLPSNPPAAYVAARTRAKKVLDAAVPRIPHLTVEVKAPAGVTATVKVDGETLSDALIGVSHPVDPGNHSLEATAPDCLTASRTVTLGEGENASAMLAVEPDPEAQKRRLAAAEKVAPSPPPSRGRGTTRRAFGYVGLAVGAAGVAVGSVTGAFALSKRSDLVQACPNQRCGPASQSELDSAKLDGTLSTIGFVAAGVGIAAGLTLLLWPDSAKVSSGALTLQPIAGIAAAGVQGSF